MSGNIVRVSGFTNANYNTWLRVSAKADDSHLTLVGFAVAAGTETSAGANVLLTGSTLNNGIDVQDAFPPAKVQLR